MNNGPFFTIDGQLYLDCYPLYLEWIAPLFCKRACEPLKHTYLSTDTISAIFSPEPTAEFSRKFTINDLYKGKFGG